MMYQARSWGLRSGVRTEYFLTAGNTASAKGASLWGFLGAENFEI